MIKTWVKHQIIGGLKGVTVHLTMTIWNFMRKKEHLDGSRRKEKLIRKKK